MPYTNSVFQQDLKAVKNALEKEDFHNLNIFANRIMSNSYIFKDPSRMICGLILKDLALTLLPLGSSKKTKSVGTAKALAAGFFKKLYEQSKSEISTKDLWSDYHEFSNATKRHLMDEHEEAGYIEEDPKFTHEAVNVLLSKLKEQRECLLSPRCLLLKGILNEIGRLYKVHGGELSDEFVFALITSLDRCYEYITDIFGDNDSIFVEKVSSIIQPEVDKIFDIIKKIENNNGSWIPDVDEELFKLSGMWREYFVLYMEHGQPAKETSIRLPEESRKKLTEAIARSLEEELPKKNK